MTTFLDNIVNSLSSLESLWLEGNNLENLPKSVENLLLRKEFWRSLVRFTK